jgi:hypothetical protein
MEDVQHEFCGGTARWRNLWTEVSAHDGSAGIADIRVARLFIVLSEIDEAVAGIGGMPESELRGLVSGAIRGCGFSDPAEVRWVLTSVLEAIDAPQTPWIYVL